ncbi:MAG: hypothetical protein O2967_15115 [Proteobacteria bacterium]|nr:hypothetical protein [Pseudomonadota bacterium]
MAIIAGLLIAAPVFELSAQLEPSVVGTLDASGESTIPHDAAIGVQASSGAQDAQAIADLFRSALADAGYQPPSSGGYVLSFKVSSDSPDGGRHSSFELRGDGGSRSGRETDLTMRWKTTRRDAAPTDRGRRLTISVVDGERNEVWQARVELHGSVADDLTVVQAVLPAVMANFGRTVYALRVP